MFGDLLNLHENIGSLRSGTASPSCARQSFLCLSPAVETPRLWASDPWEKEDILEAVYLYVYPAFYMYVTLFQVYLDSLGSTNTQVSLRVHLLRYNMVLSQPVLTKSTLKDAFGWCVESHCPSASSKVLYVVRYLGYFPVSGVLAPCFFCEVCKKMTVLVLCSTNNHFDSLIL